MGRLLGIDYGTKRTGLAVTDPLQLIASPLEAVSTEQAFKRIQEYIAAEDVEALVMGLPKGLDGKATDMTAGAVAFGEKLKQAFPELPLHWVDERFTSKMAERSMIQSGVSKKNRRIKGNVDKISAAIILQSFMEGR